MPQKATLVVLHSPPPPTYTCDEHATGASWDRISAVFLLLCATGVVPSINIQHRRSIEARHGRKVVVAGAAVMGLVAGGCVSFVFRCSSFVAGASVGLEPGC